MNKAFTTENFDKLKRTCEKIISLCKENVDGQLMMTQAQFLGDNFKEFVENPLVQSSGVIKDYGKYKEV